MRHCRRHLPQGDKGFVTDQPFLLLLQVAVGAVHQPVQPAIYQGRAQGHGHPDHQQALFDAHNQVTRFLVDLNHRRDVDPLGIEQRNVVLDKQMLRWADELLFTARLIDIVVTGRDSHLVIEGAVKVIIRLNHAPNQRRVARPDHHTVRGIDIGQQHVWQMGDMIEELATGIASRLRIDLGVALIQARIK
ncbi:hypothetical protein D3C78_808490 [compost metagenome]